MGVRPSKGRGQSFLTDASVAARQAMAAWVALGDDVLEVGGGLGVLTRELSARGARVRVIEIEPALAAGLAALRLPGVRVEEGDALAADLGAPAKVVANLPYSISTRLVERLAAAGPETMVLLLQREFAERLAARPGGKSWSRLGAVVQRDYAVEILEDVPPHAFAPQPEVHSSVVRLTRRPGERAARRGDYRFLVGRLFASRRKKVRNTVGRAAAHFHIAPPEAVREAERLGVADHRPEELSCDEFDALCAALASRRTHK
ncbi:MAG TPA: 16S rRNA (adenine(1518)-N(6)/adenine(1519)-N(6))-dimethyltransferase RsmA [Candidatus Thermoplasmatota archaeon]